MLLDLTMLTDTYYRDFMSIILSRFQICFEVAFGVNLKQLSAC